ncbi:MAG: SufE family protein [Rickettsiales bacterium]|jgi:sulfur transfer protein SufE|nr:SufE family protein [Rickettsiales bacterium]
MNYTQIKSLLTQIDDPVLKLETVMDFGKQIRAMPRPCASTEISGCASRVEICRSGGAFYGDADSALVRGVVAILVAMANSGVKNMRDEFSGLNLSLGAGRLSGVDSMIRYFESL